MKLDNNKYAVIGWGNGATAFAADLKLKGCTVNVYNRSHPKNSCKTITVEGNTKTKGTITLDEITADLSKAIDGAKILLCCVPSHGFEGIARKLAPVLNPGQMILLSPGGTGGVLEFRKALKDSGCKFAENVFVAEAEDLPYACRRSIVKMENDNISEFNIHIYKAKESTPTAGLPQEKSKEFFDIVKDNLPMIKECEEGIFRTSMNNINPFFHTIPVNLMIDRLMNNEEFDYYIDGFTPQICEVLVKADKERVALAKALDITVPSALEWLKETYGLVGDDFYTTIHSNESYRGIKAPKLNNSPTERDNLRYINEDMRTGLIPFVELGAKLGVPTPIMKEYLDKTIELCNPGHFDKNTRTLESMGLADLTVEQIKALAKKSEPLKHHVTSHSKNRTLISKPKKNQLEYPR